jgi:hypothetical protein
MTMPGATAMSNPEKRAVFTNAVFGVVFIVSLHMGS